MTLTDSSFSTDDVYRRKQSERAYQKKIDEGPVVVTAEPTSSDQ